MEQDQIYGKNILESLERLAQDGYCLRMSNISQRTDLELSLMTLPSSAMIVNGILLKLPMLASPIEEKGSSLLPTVVSSDCMNVLGKNDHYKLTKNGRMRRHTAKGKNASLN